VETDIFISYSRLDNKEGQVDALCKHLEASYKEFSGRTLRYFLDSSTINGMDDWRNKVQEHLRDSRLFLAILSPNYIKSEYCRWEWEDFVRYEAMRQCLGDGVAPVFFLKLEEATSSTESSIASWIQEIRRRQRFDLLSWREKGELALHEEHVRQTLEDLHASVRERLDRSARALRSPSNILRHNPAFVGRVHELTQVREALCKNKLGVLGTAQPRATVQGVGGMGKTELALAYAHAFAWDYPGGRWRVPCDTMSDLRAALSSLNGPLGFSYSHEEIAEISLRFERVLRELNSRERCLIILDNVSQPELLAPDLLDRLPRNGQLDLIATTRLASTSIPGSAQESSFIAVDELPLDDALALMRSHQPSGKFVSADGENEAGSIVKLLRGFTLAVETAAIFLGRNADPNACRAYRERIERALFAENEAAAKDSTVAVRHRIASIAETLERRVSQTPSLQRHHCLVCPVLELRLRRPVGVSTLKGS
jgi:hypothetical protein